MNEERNKKIIYVSLRNQQNWDVPKYEKRASFLVCSLASNEINATRVHLNVSLSSTGFSGLFNFENLKK